jgi:3-deoxy-manno-octulosonate cytidylyltransferase (CMP-KDO synthetase)
LPGKPLVELCGKPLVLHALDVAQRSGAAFVAVATDDERIVATVEGAGGVAYLTSPEHRSGTDRVAEVVDRLGLSPDAIVVNLQGDEPLLDPAVLRDVASSLEESPRAGAATAATPIRTAAELTNPNVVKVVSDGMGQAVSFSRAPIPWVRDLFRPYEPIEVLPDEPTFLRHLGLYAYRVAALRRVAAHPAVAIEEAEALEQLRMLWLGIPIKLLLLEDEPGHGVDTEEDRRAVEELLRRRAEGEPRGLVAK